MGKERHGNRILYFTLATASLIVVASAGGLLSAGTYSRETVSWAAQGIGQDLVNLVVIVPTLVISSLYVVRRTRPALFVLLGAMMYTIYTYSIYCFAVHFNQFFLVYCAILGLSAYATIVITSETDIAGLKSWFDHGTSARLAAGLLFVLALAFSVLWLSEIVPAILRNTMPRSQQEAGLNTNPVHVLDLSIVLPGFFIASVLFWKKHTLGYLLVPTLLVFATLMDITIGFLIIYMEVRDVAANGPPAILFALLGILTMSVFAGLVRPKAHPDMRSMSVQKLFTNVKGS